MFTKLYNIKNSPALFCICLIAFNIPAVSAEKGLSNTSKFQSTRAGEVVRDAFVLNNPGCKEATSNVVVLLDSTGSPTIAYVANDYKSQNQGGTVIVDKEEAKKIREEAKKAARQRPTRQDSQEVCIRLLTQYVDSWFE